MNKLRLLVVMMLSLLLLNCGAQPSADADASDNEDVSANISAAIDSP